MAERVENIDSLVGVWSRRSIRWPGGREDTTTRVYWLQGRPHYADIRIPASRPSFAGVRSLQDCDAEKRTWLTRQEGFAGTLVVANGAWLWNREIDFHPPTGKRDIGRLAFTDERMQTMIEEGVDEPYVEVWERIDDAASTGRQAFVARLRGDSQAGLLVAVGEHFILAVNHQKAGIEISHGMRRDSISKWIVTESTFPWREGTLLFGDSKPVVCWKERQLIVSRLWEILEPSTGQLDWID
jgi:hypothetical protein